MNDVPDDAPQRPDDEPVRPDESALEGPPILRVTPIGDVVRPGWEIPVVIRVRWADGRTGEEPGFATAWTRNAVEVHWNAPGFGHSIDWVPNEDVRPENPTRRR